MFSPQIGLIDPTYRINYRHYGAVLSNIGIKGVMQAFPKQTQESFLVFLLAIRFLEWALISTVTVNWFIPGSSVRLVFKVSSFPSQRDALLEEPVLRTLSRLRKYQKKEKLKKTSSRRRYEPGTSPSAVKRATTWATTRARDNL